MLALFFYGTGRRFSRTAPCSAAGLLPGGLALKSDLSFGTLDQLSQSTEGIAAFFIELLQDLLAIGLDLLVGFLFVDPFFFGQALSQGSVVVFQVLVEYHLSPGVDESAYIGEKGVLVISDLVFYKLVH